MPAPTRSRRAPGPALGAARPRTRQRRRLASRPFGRPTPEFFLLLATITVLLLIGLVMTFSASFVTSTAETGDAFEIFRRQLLWSAVGAVPLIVAARTDYRRWRGAAVPLLLLTLLSLVAVAIPSIGIEVNGARRWLGAGAWRFQPTELAKLTVPLFLAHVLARRWRVLRSGDLLGLLVPGLPLLVLTGGLIMLEPDFETAALIALIGGAVLYAAGLPGRLIALAGAVLAVLATVGVSMSEFRRGRVLAWLDPFSDPANFGYQTTQGYLALGSGGWFGAGLGEGRGKWLFVPNAHTDFIYAIIGEELGLIGALLVLGLFASLAVAGTRTALRAPDPFGRLLAVGITGWMLLQAGINMGSVVGLLPVTGVTLPLVSFGGTSLVSTMFGLGLLLSIARAGVDPEPRPSFEETS